MQHKMKERTKFLSVCIIRIVVIQAYSISIKYCWERYEMMYSPCCMRNYLCILRVNWWSILKGKWFAFLCESPTFLSDTVIISDVYRLSSQHEWYIKSYACDIIYHDSVKTDEIDLFCLLLSSVTIISVLARISRIYPWGIVGRKIEQNDILYITITWFIS